MSTDAIVTIATTVVTILLAALHTSGRFTALETKVDLIMERFHLVPKKEDE